MSTFWTLRAQASLQAIFVYIADDDPVAAHAMVDRLIDSVDTTLGKHPLAGRPGRVDGTREWVAHRSYIIAYRVSAAGDVEVLDVVHGARLWPETFEPQ